jgi:hypothetical protein
MMLIDMLPHAFKMARVTKLTEFLRFGVQEAYVKDIFLSPWRAGTEARVLGI